MVLQHRQKFRCNLQNPNLPHTHTRPRSSKKKNDNHANDAFKTESNQLRNFIAKQPNMFIVCGDRHWQYISQHPSKKIREYSCGPTSDKHAGGWKQSNLTPLHKYLKVKGGFLSVSLTYNKNKPSLTFIHHGTNNQRYNIDRQQPS